jgi:hypothetical protein
MFLSFIIVLRLRLFKMNLSELNNEYIFMIEQKLNKIDKEEYIVN